MRRLNTLGLVLRRVAPAVLIAGSLSACVVRGHARVWVPAPAAVVVVEQPPPPPPPRATVVVRPGFVWIEGRHHWDGHRYVWRDGYYERERAGHVYRPGRWTRRGNGHVWVDGRWEARGSVDRRTHKHDDRSRVRDHR